MELQTEERPEIHIGFYDSEIGPPTYDDAHSCPVCGEILTATGREVMTILIHCTRWPLCTFLRFHKDEIDIVADVRYHEIVVEALFERARIEASRRTAVPDAFRGVFG